MKTAALTITVLSCMTASAFAQDASALCKLMRTESAVPGAAYQSGVDVNGHPVVPADLNATPSMMPDVVKIPLTIDLAKRLNTAPPAGTEMESKMGDVEIRKDGSVSFNGQDLTPQAQTLCGMAQAAPQVTHPEPPVAPKVTPPAMEQQHAEVTPYEPKKTEADWQSAIKPAHKTLPGSISSSEESADLTEKSQPPAPPGDAGSSIVKQVPDQPADKDVIWGQDN